MRKRSKAAFSPGVTGLEERLSLSAFGGQAVTGALSNAATGALSTIQVSSNQTPSASSSKNVSFKVSQPTNATISKVQSGIPVNNQAVGAQSSISVDVSPSKVSVTQPTTASVS